MDRQEELILSNMNLVLLGVLAGVVSFLLVSKLIEPEPLPPAIYALHIKEAGERLKTCMKDGKNRQACRSYVAKLDSLLKDAPIASFNYSKNTNFSVMLLDNMLFLRKTACTRRDLAVDEFHWRAWPLTPSALAPRYRAQGFVGGFTRFSRQGYRLGKTCLLAIDLPVGNLIKLEIGQYDRTARRWTWRFEERI